MKRTTLRADAVLLVAAVIWGGGFVAQRVAMRHMGPYAFNALRFALGTIVLLPVIAAWARPGAIEETRPSDLKSDGRRHFHLIAGALAGFVLFIAVSLQQIGLVYTTAGKAGFITGLYLPLVPILGLVIGEHTRIATWVGVGLALTGLYFLSVPGNMEINRGDVYVLACAVVSAVHVLIIGWISPRGDALRLGLVQFAVVAVLSAIVAVMREPITADGLRASTWAIAYGGLGSVAVAFTLQLIGQRDAPSGHAALLMGMETVFAAVAGYLVLSETFGARELLGAALMLTGFLVSQIPRLLSARAQFSARADTPPSPLPPGHHQSTPGDNRSRNSAR